MILLASPPIFIHPANTALSVPRTVIFFLFLSSIVMSSEVSFPVQSTLPYIMIKSPLDNSCDFFTSPGSLISQIKFGFEPHPVVFLPKPVGLSSHSEGIYSEWDVNDSILLKFNFVFKILKFLMQ